jgi:hypothetical protein
MIHTGSIYAYTRSNAQHMGLVGVRVAVSMGIFDALAAGGESPQTLSQLAEKTKGDETLLRMSIKHPPPPRHGISMKWH